MFLRIVRRCVLLKPPQTPQPSPPHPTPTPTPDPNPPLHPRARRESRSVGRFESQGIGPAFRHVLLFRASETHKVKRRNSRGFRKQWAQSVCPERFWQVNSSKASLLDLMDVYNSSLFSITFGDSANNIPAPTSPEVQDALEDGRSDPACQVVKLSFGGVDPTPMAPRLIFWLVNRCNSP